MSTASLSQDLPVSRPASVLRAMALVAVGALVGFALASEPVTVDPGPHEAVGAVDQTIEDWHGNVRRSTPAE